MTHAAADCDLEELCHLAGWPCNRRSEGKLAVALEIPCAYAQAILSNNRGTAAAVELPIGAQLSSTSRDAVTLFLLALERQVPGVRAEVGTNGAAHIAALRSPLEYPPSAAALNHLLSALSVAARMSIRELPLLADETVAAKYLSIRGASSGSAHQVEPNEKELCHE